MSFATEEILYGDTPTREVAISGCLRETQAEVIYLYGDNNPFKPGSIIAKPSRDKGIGRDRGIGVISSVFSRSSYGVKWLAGGYSREKSSDLFPRTQAPSVGKFNMPKLTKLRAEVIEELRSDYSEFEPGDIVRHLKTGNRGVVSKPVISSHCSVTWEDSTKSLTVLDSLELVEKAY